MPIVVPVKFPFASRDLWFDPQQLDIIEADYAICATERGTEIGLVTADPFEVTEDELRAPLKPVLRIATDEDLDRADELARRGEAAMNDFRALVKQNGLDMKPVGVEYLFGGERAVFYFAAEDRVDFRQLVRDLSARLRTRVDMRQIGVRDEARLVGGLAHCGQELCCARFGGQFEPVSIRMAKEQDLPLNSAKISGVCGRLMCCLRYEFEAYKDFKGRAPKKKALIDTPLGKARIQEYDTPREQLVLRLENGKVFRVDLSAMTCSDACKKKAEKQGCACRPDCVTRDVLEKLESPDIALALMELDRENGIDVGDGLSNDDRIVTSSPARRRKCDDRNENGSGAAKNGKGARSGKGGAANNAPDEGDAAPSRRRRKHSAGKRTDAGASEQPKRAGDAGSSAQGASRRHRRHLSSDERNDAFMRAAAREAVQEQGSLAPGEAKTSGKARRRHRTTLEPQKPTTPSVASQVAKGDVKVTRRRPGDGGGAQRAHEAPGKERAAHEGAGSAGKPSKQAGEASSHKRRRRRSRKPKQAGGGSAPGRGSSQGGASNAGAQGGGSGADGNSRPSGASGSAPSAAE